MRETRYFQNRRNEVPDMVLAQEVMRDSRELAKEVHAKLHEFAPDALDSIKELADDEEISPAVRLKANEILLRHSGMSLEKRVDMNLTVNVGNGDMAALIEGRLDRLREAAVVPGELEH